MSDLKRMVWYPTTEENIKHIPTNGRVVVYSPLYPNDMTMTYRIVDVQFMGRLNDITHFCILDTPINMNDYYSR